MMTFQPPQTSWGRTAPRCSNDTPKLSQEIGPASQAFLLHLKASHFPSAVAGGILGAARSQPSAARVCGPFSPGAPCRCALRARSPGGRICSQAVL